MTSDAGLDNFSVVSFLVIGFRKGRFICPLSNPNFSPKQNLVLPEPVSKFAYIHSYCCNGVLFLDDWESFLPREGIPGTAGTYGKSVIWNPLFGDGDCGLKVLPPTSLKPHPDADSSSFVCGGFGFDYVSRDYKVVRFLENSFLEVEYDPDRVVYEVELYSLESDSWKRIPYDCQVCPSIKQTVYIDGVQLWKAFNDELQCSLLAFNFTTEKFFSTPFPERLFDSGTKEDDVDILNYNRSIVAVVYPRNGINKHFVVWLCLNDHWSHWSKIFTIGPIPGAHRPLGFPVNSTQMFLEGSNHQLLLYDYRTNKLEEIDIRDDIPRSLRIIPYDFNVIRLDHELLGKKKKGIQINHV